MKPRHQLTAADLTELHAHLARRLETVGIPSPPEVAMKLLALGQDPNAQLAAYAKTIRSDAAITGRVLRLSNSAVYGQRKPVTTLERACVVLGIERLRAVSLGVHLAGSASKGADADFSRMVWGQSVLRACLAAESARHVAPGLAAEAFVVGLMMDAGLPLMTTLVGAQYLTLVKAATGPGALHKMEVEGLPFTHVDVASSLARRWKFPDLLLRPIELHHTKPAEPPRDDPAERLHRIAYAVGMLDLAPKGAVKPFLSPSTPGLLTGQRVLGLTGEETAGVVRAGVHEYEAMIGMFADVASAVVDPATLMERVHAGLARVLEESIEAGLAREARAEPARVAVGTNSVEIRWGEDGGAVACLFDRNGHPMMVHRMAAGHVAQAGPLCEALGISPTPAEIAGLSGILRRPAA